MNFFEMIFTIDTQAKIVISINKSITKIGLDEEVPIVFLNQKHTIVIADGLIYFNLRDLRDFLLLVLDNNLVLDESITQDIGYLSNKYDKSKQWFPLELFANGYEGWVGDKYSLWYVYANTVIYTTWLYNSCTQEIIFEITPHYPYLSCDIKKERYFVPYKKWIKNYKPYFKTQLSRETAQQWYEQADHFVKTVDDNSARLKKECEEKTCETCSKREQRKKIAKRNYDI